MVDVIVTLTDFQSSSLLLLCSASLIFALAFSPAMRFLSSTCRCVQFTTHQKRGETEIETGTTHQEREETKIEREASTTHQKRGETEIETETETGTTHQKREETETETDS